MLLLAFDTSADMVSVAVLDEKKVYAVAQDEMVHGQAENLMPMIDQALQHAHLTLKQLGGIAVTTGPGSFTGVRVALSAARAFGLALNIPVHGVTCFEAVAHNCGQAVRVVLDSKRDDYYSQSFDDKGFATSPPALETTEDLRNQLPFTAIGSGAEKLGKEIGCSVLKKTSPMAVSVGQVAFTRLSEPLPPEPLYLRDADVSL